MEFLMNKNQLISDIKTLELAGKIKEAQVLRNRLNKGSQFIMSQMPAMNPQVYPQMTTVMPQAVPQVVPQMMVPVQRSVVNPGVTPAPMPIAQPRTTPVQTIGVTPPVNQYNYPPTAPPTNKQIRPPYTGTTPIPNPLDNTQRGYGNQQSKDQEMQYLQNELKRLQDQYGESCGAFASQCNTIRDMIQRNQGGNVIRKSTNMNKFEKLAKLNKDIEVLENAGKFKAAEILQKKFLKEAQAFSYEDTSANYDVLGYSGPRQNMPDTYGNEELNSQIRQNIINNKQQNPSVQSSNPAESDTANVNAFNEGMYAQINPLTSTPQNDYKTLINQAKNYIASGDMNTAAQIKQQALNSNMTPQQKAAFQQQYNNIVQNYSNTANNPQAFQAQENAQNAIAKAAKSLNINTNDPQAIRQNEQAIRSKLKQMGLLNNQTQQLLRQVSLSGYFIKRPQL